MDLTLCNINTQYFSELTGTPEGLKLLSSHPPSLRAVAGRLHDEEIYTAKDAMRTFINISAEEGGAESLLSLENFNMTEEMAKV